MAIVLVWNDAKSFKQHLERMETFRQSHRNQPENRLPMLKDTPAPKDTRSFDKTERAKGFISMRGKSVIVPMWDIALPKNSQN